MSAELSHYCWMISLELSSILISRRLILKIYNFCFLQQQSKSSISYFLCALILSEYAHQQALPKKQGSTLWKKFLIFSGKDCTTKQPPSTYIATCIGQNKKGRNETRVAPIVLSLFEEKFITLLPLLSPHTIFWWLTLFGASLQTQCTHHGCVDYAVGKSGFLFLLSSLQDFL